MANVQETLVTKTEIIKQVIETLERSEAKVALVVDENRYLLGTVTDGDVRRGILRGVQLSDPVSTIMNDKPRVGHVNDDPASVLAMMRRNLCRQVPILDGAGRVVSLMTLQEAVQLPDRPNRVFLMAGGRGQRLRPLTDSCPKPMLPVGGTPVLQIIIENLVRQGFRHLYISVNYMRRTVQEYFGDGSNWNAKITYIEEDEDFPLGTAGALGLLPELPDCPLIVMNADILTKVSLEALLDFHNETQSKGTMCVRDYVLRVPYGVVEAEEHRFGQILEKPTQHFLVNAGVYVLDPHVIKLVQQGRSLDMPELFAEMVRNGLSATIFPVREYWLDIGHMEDFNRANNDYGADVVEILQDSNAIPSVTSFTDGTLKKTNGLKPTDGRELPGNNTDG